MSEVALATSSTSGFSGSLGISRKSDSPQKLVIKVLEEAIRQFRLENLMSPRSFDEKWEIKVKRGFDTAAWHYDSDAKIHRIIVGTQCLKSLKPDSSEEDCVAHVKRLLRHERGHAIHTHRNLSDLTRLLDKARCPFQAYNFGEDAMIESRERKAEGDFGWTLNEEVQEADSPWSLLFNHIQSDGKKEVPVSKKLDKAVQEKVWTYYTRLCAAQNSHIALDISIQMYKEFEASFSDSKPRSALAGLTGISTSSSAKPTGPVAATLILINSKEEKEAAAQHPKDAEGKPLGDLQLSAYLAQNSENAKKFLVSVFSFDPKSGTLESPEDQKARESKKTEESETKDIPLSEYSSTVNEAMIFKGRVYTLPNEKSCDQLAYKLSMAFKAKKRMGLSEFPDKRIDSRSLALDSDKPYWRPKSIKKSKKKIFCLFDMSGSMRGDPSSGAAALLTILNKLTANGSISGHVAFSAANLHITFPLPLRKDLVTMVNGHAGSEGLEPALKHNMSLLKSADHVFVYTDADIVDRPIDKDDFARVGVFTTGLYIGESGAMTKALRYFDKVLFRPTIEELIDQMIVSLL